jgi:hypothetical protein
MLCNSTQSTAHLYFACGAKCNYHSLGFLSPINYALELVRFRNEVEKESATLRDVERPLSFSISLRKRPVGSIT